MHRQALVVLGDRLPGRRAVLIRQCAVDALAAGEDDPIDAGLARHLEHSDAAHHVDLVGVDRVAVAGGAHLAGCVDDVPNAVVADDLGQARRVAEVALGKGDLAAQVRQHRVVLAAAHHHDGPLILDQHAGDPRPNGPKPTGDQNGSDVD